MFWSGNFIVVRELNFLLKEENVTLAQVLEADDILQECKADNKALMQFLTRPDILAELITLITEEPPKNVELAQQYRHASIACEVLTSPLSMLSDRLSLDTAQMNRLCDFINRDPPLNPLLASYFSKTVEMLLERSPKQDWYLYHIVCLRVLDFLKARRDFLPNLLRHISTSAIADTFKFFIRLDDLFNTTIMEWLEEHQFIESLIQIICGTFVSDPREEPEKGQREPSEKARLNHSSEPTDEGSHDEQNNPTGAAPAAREAGAAAARTAAVASANAAALLCDLVATGCAAEGASTRSRTSWVLVARLAAAGGVRALLQAVFTSAGPARPHAVVNGCRLLLALLSNHPVLGSEGASERCNVELAVAPHLPLLHQALLHDPHHYEQEEGTGGGGTRAEGGAGAVGAARVHTAALLAHLASSEVEEVPTTMLTLGTAGVLIDMFFKYSNNNFLHAQLHTFVRNALANPAYRTQYARHLLVECDLLTRLMDAFEENENKQGGWRRAGYMGHVTLMLGGVQEALAEGGELARLTALPPHAQDRWRAFRDHSLPPVLHHYCTPLGGSYPSENLYEVDNITDTLAGNYDFNYANTAESMDEVGDDGANDIDIIKMQDEYHMKAMKGVDSAEFIADGLGLDDDDKMQAAKSNFLELANQRFDDDMWEDAPEGEAGAPADEALREVLADSPWDSAAEAGARAGDAAGWAQFEPAPPAGPFEPPFQHYWPYEEAGGPSSKADSLAPALASLRLEERARSVSLATKLLNAMARMSPAAIDRIVNANVELEPCPEDGDAPDVAETGRLLDPAPDVLRPPESDAVVDGPDPPRPADDAVTLSAGEPNLPGIPPVSPPGPTLEVPGDGSAVSADVVPSPESPGDSMARELSGTEPGSSGAPAAVDHGEPEPADRGPSPVQSAPVAAGPADSDRAEIEKVPDYNSKETHSTCDVVTSVNSIEGAGVAEQSEAPSER